MSAINSTAIATFFGSDDSLDHIRSDCSTKYHLKHRDPYVPRQGRYGTISEACLKSNCRFIIKSLPLATDIQRKVFQKEVLISRAIGKAGIGPEVHDVFICMKCKTKRRGVDVHEVIMKNSRKALKGKCSFCGTVMFKFIKK